MWDSVGHCGTVWDSVALSVSLSVGQCGTVWDSVGQCGTPPANTLGQQQEKLESELEFVETLLKFVQNRLEFEQTHSMHQISWLRQQRGKYSNWIQEIAVNTSENMVLA